MDDCLVHRAYQRVWFYLQDNFIASGLSSKCVLQFCEPGRSVSLVTRLTWTRGSGLIPGGGPLWRSIQTGCGMHPATKFCTVTPNICVLSRALAFCPGTYNLYVSLENLCTPGPNQYVPWDVSKLWQWPFYLQVALKVKKAWRCASTRILLPIPSSCMKQSSPWQVNMLPLAIQIPITLCNARVHYQVSPWVVDWVQNVSRLLSFL